MRNHDQKIKDMAESVLPSTAGKSARDGKAKLNRTRRHEVRQRLHTAVRVGVRGAPDSVDDVVDLGEDADGLVKSRMTEVVFDRRIADKTGPLCRWAVARVRRDPALRGSGLEAQVAYFRRLLPDNTIGRHAVTHIESALWWEERRRQRSSRPPVRRDRRAELRAAAERVLAEGRLGDLNRAIKDAHPSTWDGVAHVYGGRDSAPRPLLGGHDVEDFVLARAERSHDVLLRFVAALDARSGG